MPYYTYLTRPNFTGISGKARFRPLDYRACFRVRTLHGRRHLLTPSTACCPSKGNTTTAMGGKPARTGFELLPTLADRLLALLDGVGRSIVLSVPYWPGVRLVAHLLLPLRIRLGKRIYNMRRTNVDHVDRLDRWTCVKWFEAGDKYVDIEVANMVFVAGVVGAVAPRFLDVVLYTPPASATSRAPRPQKGIVMEYKRGEPLESAWCKMSAAERLGFRADFAHFLRALRVVPPPFRGYVGSPDGRPCSDFKAHTSWQTNESIYGPFHSVPAFHDWLISNLQRRRPRELPTTLREGLPDRPDTVLSHADLHLDNVLIHNGRLSAIIDWATLGWYPDYWEYHILRRQEFGPRPDDEAWETCLEQMYEVDLRTNLEELKQGSQGIRAFGETRGGLDTL